jgi:fructoselysine-6-P-deglycase FrlB-like protein
MIPQWEMRTKEPFYMAEAIKDIPQALEACLEENFLLSMQKTMGHIKPTHIYLVGCGTSYNACESAAYTCRRTFGVQAEAHDALEFKLDTPVGVDPGALVISISHSGKTLETCLAQDKAKILGAFTVGISAMPDSRLVTTANLGITDPNPYENRPRGKIRSFHTSSLQGMLVPMMTASPKIRDEFILQAKKVVEVIRQNLDSWEKSGRMIASQWAGITTHYMLAGFGSQKPTADEIGLKIVEVLGEGATNFSLEEFAHGPGASFRKNMGIILFQTDPRSLERCLEIARGVAVSEAQLVVITDQPTADWPKTALVIPLPFIENQHLFGLFPAAAAAQNLLYFLAIEKGMNPDVNCLDKFPELAEVSAIFFPPGTH